MSPNPERRDCANGSPRVTTHERLNIRTTSPVSLTSDQIVQVKLAIIISIILEFPVKCFSARLDNFSVAFSYSKYKSIHIHSSLA